MAYHAQQLIVGEHVHQPRVHAHTAVGARKGVGLAGEIHFEVQRYAVGVGHAVGEPLETLGVGVALAGHLVFLVHLFHGLAHNLRQVFVGEGGCLAGLDQAREQAQPVGARRGGGAAQQHDAEQQRA